MKKCYTFLLPVGLCAAVALVVPSVGYSKIVTNVKPDISAEQLKAIVVEDFEATDQAKWTVDSTPKKLANPPKPEDNPVEKLEMKIIDGAPADMVPEKWASNNKGTQNKKCIGVLFKFRYPGANSVHVIPKDGIELPGRSRAISLWFHSRGHDYTLEAWVEDFQGNVHVLKFGSVDYVGWRPLKTYIPTNIPQKISTYPQTRFLKIKRFVIRAKPEALTEDTYFFFDQIKVLTDDYEVNFDGEKLHEAFTKGGGAPAKDGAK
ncbi:MAG TPA: flagellar filament outer layer protein FlaA [Spirochaetota bacterium]|mgnify:CR=1 FL=1|nr:flagellar filament outer layer protein FlaA [Spirochaetota bacterium]HNT10008.1 flagellar filament outer layer protein FlaA [Spirochaetota bacterium]HNV47394.1 flagellar filament outer layer protein FlaA [Spirochaetota bacterium]HOS39723.1 flagellar filament outer layer protein FlaA [Spirochaetota bacterium]HPU87692.1 flagellar filament outer layer protein FlaA [Spirochaetota bacterium]